MSQGPYERADFGPLRDRVYGLGVHWTTHTMPREGEPLPFAGAVEAFDVPRFADQAAEAGAGYVLFTLTHADHAMPCPHPEVDRLIAGRTCERDLIMELIDALAARGIAFGLYYNHGTRRTDDEFQDPAWYAAVGAGAADQTTYYANYCRIIAHLGERYGEKLIAWWFDSAPSLIARGEPPWARMAEAAKAGHPARLIAYNSGIEETGFEPVTERQDYFAGESTSLDFRPSGRTTPAGLSWHAYCSWHPARDGLGRIKPNTRAARWVMHSKARGVDWPPPEPDRVLAYLDAFRACRGAVTFNALCFQGGSLYNTDLAVLRAVKAYVRE